MASIEHVATGQVHLLASSHLVGRGGKCDLCIASDLVSETHAAFRWNGQAWELHDLDSSNGTWVDDRRLEPRQWQPLARGMCVAFGERVNVYQVRDIAPPVVVAYPADADPARADELAVYGDDEGLTLPREGEPLFLIQDGGQGRWFVHDLSVDERRAIRDREILSVDDAHWCIVLPVARERTRKPGETQRRFEDIGLRFYVTRDEEHAEVAVLHGDKVIPLPSRAWDYFLSHLARARQQDALDESRPDSEHGWLPAGELADGFGVSENTIRAYVHRAHRLLSRHAGVMGADGLIERRRVADGRRATQMMRIGVRWLVVEREGAGVSETGNPSESGQ